MQQFSFANAMTHWTRTEGPKGFLWKYALAYGVVSVLIIVGILFLLGRPFVEYMQIATEMEQTGTVDEAALLSAMGALFLPALLFIPIGILFWVAFEGALQRRYMHGESFSLRIGADEGRLFVVGLFWFGLFLALYFGLAIVVGIVAAGAAMALQGNPEIVVVIMIPLFLLILVALLYFVVRFSPASALTVRDRAIRFSSAWGATRGRVWPMVFAFLIMLVAAYILSTVLQLVMFGVVGGVVATSGIDFTDTDPKAIMAVLLSPVTFGIAGLVYLVMTAFQALIQFAWAGIPALAAKTDPNWIGAASGADDTFA